MNSVFFILLAFTLPVIAAPKFGPGATRLFHSRDFLKSNPAPDYWAISPYYVSQQDARSCSVATASMILNAARASKDLEAQDSLITQKGLLSKVNEAVWNRGVGAGGRGISLDQYGPLMESAFKAYGLETYHISTHHAESSPDFAKKVEKDLIENEKSEKSFIIVNYLQSEFTGDPEGAVGHYAPVAAYDAVKRKVLIMDPDREYYEPYWVSLETFLKGMNTVDAGEKKTRGYLKLIRTSP